MTLYEVALISGRTVSIDLEKIESVVEEGQWVTVTMASGASHALVIESFVGLLQTADVKWFKFNREAPAEQDVAFEDLPEDGMEELVETE